MLLVVLVAMMAGWMNLAEAQVATTTVQLTVTSLTGTALQVDAGMAPPAGGGFEVRLRDWWFGV